MYNCSSKQPGTSFHRRTPVCRICKCSGVFSDLWVLRFLFRWRDENSCLHTWQMPNLTWLQRKGKFSERFSGRALTSRGGLNSWLKKLAFIVSYPIQGNMSVLIFLEHCLHIPVNSTATKKPLLCPQCFPVATLKAESAGEELSSRGANLKICRELAGNKLH